MLGPHYERLAQVEQRMTSNQMLQRVQRHVDNPLHQVIDKLKKQFTEYDTAYSEDIMDHKISSVDRLLSFDGKLGPIFAALQKQNNLLRKQLSVLESQLSSTVSICEQIIEENRQLKKICEQKNNDMSKIIETIASNESEARTQLQEKVNILQQENSILISHLEEVKKVHEGYTEKFRHKEDEIYSWKRKWEEVKKHLDENISREHDLSRKLALAEHNLYQQTQNVYQNEQKIQTLLFENNELKNQVMLDKDENSMMNVETIKKKLEEEYANIIEEHRTLKRERTEMLKQTERLKLQKQKLEDGIIQMERKFKKVISDFELTNSLLTEEKQKNATMGSTVRKMESKLDELKTENNKIRLQNESTKSYWITRQRLLQQEVDNLRTQLDGKSRQTEKRLYEIKQKTKALLDAKEAEMKSINDTNNELRRLLQLKER